MTDKQEDKAVIVEDLIKNFEVIEPQLFKEIEDPVFLIAAAIQAYNDRKSKDVRQLNLVSNWKRIGRKIALRT